MKRVERVNSLIKRELGKIISREIDFPPEVLITLTRVETDKDLNSAKVYISTIPDYKSKEVFKSLKKNIFELQKKMDRKLKMRLVPKIIFKKETETVKAARVEELMEKLKNSEK